MFFLDGFIYSVNLLFVGVFGVFGGGACAPHLGHLINVYHLRYAYYY